MSHTRRIYNNPKLKKAQRFNWDALPIINDIGIKINNRIIGIPYTRRSWICMGRCPMCRDPNREPRLIRKRRKEQFRWELKSELESDQRAGRNLGGICATLRDMTTGVQDAVIT